ncbi:MAG TPA: zinc-ribbon domain-containing protein [Polyangiaceae bacterium]
MKIICQACQSKYTIADDKIQGKVAKIRCRKCGATVLVDASVSGGSRPNGSSPPPAVSEDAWLASVAEGDQRTMQMQDVIDAYNSGVITGDTYLWKEGMGDWLPLSEIAEIVEALNRANAEATSSSGSGDNYNAPAGGYGAAQSPPVAYSPPAAAVAARRETGRGRSDLFGGAPVEEEVATSAAPQAHARAAASPLGVGSSAASTQSSGTGLTGARDEHSVLFSLSTLTGAAKAGPSTSSSTPSSTSSSSSSPVFSTASSASSSSLSSSSSSSSSTMAKNDDSGLIDLNALAKAQQAKAAAESMPPPVAAPTPFLFPAALGNVETYQPEVQKKKSMRLLIGGGAAAFVLIIAIALFAGGSKEAPLPAAAPSATAPEPEVTAAATAEPAPVDSAAAAASAKAAKKAAGGSRPAAKAPAGGGAKPEAPAAPAPPPKPKSPCGCGPSDLQCQIRCSAVGH